MPVPQDPVAEPARGQSVFVVTGTYNEVEDIRTLIEGVLTALPEAIVVVVDDNSPDGTAEAVTGVSKQHPAQVILIERGGKLGLGSALRRGMKEAMERGATHVFTMDADLSHSPEYLPQMLAALEECDVVIGSRYVVGARTLNWPWRRRVVSRLGGMALRYCGGLPAYDPTGGFRGYRTEIIEQARLLNTTSKGYAFEAEALFKCAQAGAVVCEVPIVFADREKGSSKISMAIAWESLCLLLKLIGKRIIRNPFGVRDHPERAPSGEL